MDKQNTNVEYYNIKPGKLLLFYIVTSGLYGLYWFYKNWEIVKKHEGSKISPFWRAIFSFLFCHSLFKKIVLHSKEKGYKSNPTVTAYSAFYIVVYLISLFWFRVLGETIGQYYITSTLDFIFLIAAIIIPLALSCIPLMVIQKAANFSVNPKHLNIKREYEKWIIAIGILFTAYMVLASFIPK